MKNTDMEVPFIQKENYASYNVAQPLSFLGQAKLLTYKNFILTFKNPKNIIFLILTPIILSMLMAFFGWLAKLYGERILVQPPIRQIPQFPHCIGQSCVSIQYAVITPNKDDKTPQWIIQSIDYIKRRTNLSDSITMYKDKITTYEQLTNYSNNYQKNANKTQIGIMYCGGSNFSKMPYLQLFCDGNKDYAYYLVLNKTQSLSVMFHDILQPMPIDDVATSLKLLIDNSLFNIGRNKPFSDESNINYKMSQFPVGPNRYISGYDIVTEVGAFYFLITPLFAFLFIQSEIVREKQYKLRQGLNVFGASHFAYWLSWFVVANIYSLITSIATYLAGYAFEFPFFLKTPSYIIIFFLFYPFTLSMQMLSFFLSTLSPTLKAANAISYGIVLFAIVVESFVANNNLLTFLFTDDASGLVIFLKIFLSFYPPFNYTKFFTNISQHSGNHFDLATRKWAVGNGYNITTFAEEIRGSLRPLSTGGYTRYSDLISMVILLLDCIFYILLTWYFDHIIESNRGRNDSLFFPIKMILNLFKKSERKRMAFDIGVEHLKKANYIIQQQQQSTIKQRDRVYKHSKKKYQAFGLRIKDLSKTFVKKCSRNRVEAIRGFNLQIQPNQLMGILGHNGAGKTTLINVLTGIINPDQTPDLEIIINNKSIDKIDEIREYIGLCSQFDILWNEMTAEQHLYMFAKLKNVPEEVIDKKIDEMLLFVDLPNEKKLKVKNFSGGMRRRLSLAIAAIGNPKIILLDQPTTGLDPKVRQQIWDLIQKMKKGKSIILTTHSMEEADILADRLSIMVKGRLKCVGTSFYLKHKYGDGHRLALNIDDTKSKQVFKTIQKLFPKAVLVDCKGGNMIVGLNDFSNLLELTKMLESKEASGLDEFNLKKSVKDWSVSHSTLEQVFMKVTKERQH